jgi:oligoribonuclease NrnB/cAMP/cGMP phosphodiesterase (DHH superfamily)
MEEQKRKVAVLYHRDHDGFGAAYAVWKAAKDACELMFESVQYGEAPPMDKLRAFGPDEVYIVDFSYPADTLKMLSDEFTDVMVMDHHGTALAELEAWGGQFMFDLDRSGCMLAWDYFHPEDSQPELLLYVQDRDLWRFDLENSREINAYIATLPFEFDEWDNFYLPEAYTCGKAIIDFQNRQIEGRLKDVEVVEFATYAVPVVNASENISELGNELCKQYMDSPFSMTYCDRKDGKRSYSLRSIGSFDVSEVAKRFGGGGHKNAAGFTTDAPDGGIYGTV